MPHLHLPAQSGSDAVLKRMARRNRVADFERLVDAARAAIPGLTVTTDLIVGFPGETERDFEETVAFAERVGFAHMHVFPLLGPARDGRGALQRAGGRSGAQAPGARVDRSATRAWDTRCGHRSWDRCVPSCGRTRSGGAKTIGD